MRRSRPASAYLARRQGWWWVPARLAGIVLHRRSRGGRPLATEVLLVVDPARGLRRERRAMAERFRAAPFPLYGLPAAWPGPRYLAGSGSRRARGERPVVTSLSLGHGDPVADRGPQLVVEVQDEPDAPGGGPELRRALGEELSWVAAHGGEPGPGGSRPGEAEPAWSVVPIPVDGRPVRFDLLAAGRHWVAWAEVEGRTLILRARDLAVGQVELVRVGDVEPYVEGTPRLEETAARGRRQRRGAT